MDKEFHFLGGITLPQYLKIVIIIIMFADTDKWINTIAAIMDGSRKRKWSIDLVLRCLQQFLLKLIGIYQFMIKYSTCFKIQIPNLIKNVSQKLFIDLMAFFCVGIDKTIDCSSPIWFLVGKRKKTVFSLDVWIHLR